MVYIFSAGPGIKTQMTNPYDQTTSPSLSNIHVFGTIFTASLFGFFFFFFFFFLFIYNFVYKKINKFIFVFFLFFFFFVFFFFFFFFFLPFASHAIHYR